MEVKRNRFGRAKAVDYFRNLNGSYVFESCPSLDFSSAVRSLCSLNLGPAEGARRFFSVLAPPTEEDGEEVLRHVFRVLKEITPRREVSELVSRCSLSETDVCALICVALDGRQTYPVARWMSEWLSDVRCSDSVVRDKVGPLYTLMYRAMEKLPLVRCPAAAHIIPLDATPKANDKIWAAYKTSWALGGYFPMCAFETFVEIDPAIWGREEVDETEFGSSPVMLLVCHQLSGVDVTPFLAPSALVAAGTPKGVDSGVSGGKGSAAKKLRRRIAPHCPAVFYLLNCTSPVLKVVWATLAQDEGAHHRVADVRPTLPLPPAPAVPPSLRATAASVADRKNFSDVVRNHDVVLTESTLTFSTGAHALNASSDKEMQSVGLWALGVLSHTGTITSPNGVAHPPPRECFEKALQLDPRNSLAWTALAGCLGADARSTIHGKAYASSDCIVEALRINRRNPDLWFAIGEILEAGESFALGDATYNAKRCFIECLRHDARNPPAWNNLGRLMGIDEVLTVNGTEVTREACFEQATTCRTVVGPSADDAPSAEYTSESETDAAPTQPDATNGGGSSNAVAIVEAKGSAKSRREKEQAENLSQQRITCVRKLEADIEDATLWNELGGILNCMGQRGGDSGEVFVVVSGRSYNALDCFVEAVRLPGRPTEAWSNLGKCLRQGETAVVAGGEAVRNVECFTKVIEAEPTNTGAWLALAKSLALNEAIMYAGRIMTRKDCVMEVLRADPEVADAWYELGRCMSLPGESMTIGEKSWCEMNCYFSTLSLNASHTGAWVNLARMLGPGETAEVNGKEYTPVACLCCALTSEPLNAHTWTELGIRLKPGDYVRVKGCDRGKLECLTQALAIDKSIAKTWEHLSMVMKEDERFILNKKVLDHKACILEAVRLNPNARLAVDLITPSGTIQLPHAGPKGSTGL